MIRTRINADLADKKTDLYLATLIFDSTCRNDFQMFSVLSVMLA